MNFEKYINSTPYTKETRDEYKRVEREMDKLFRLDLEDEFGIPHDTPYADTLYEKAYADGHASGYSSIYSEYSEVVEFVETILKTKESHDTILTALEDERETRREWGRQRQTALDERRWVVDSLKPITDYLREMRTMGQLDCPDDYKKLAFNDVEVTAGEIRNLLEVLDGIDGVNRK